MATVRVGGCYSPPDVFSNDRVKGVQTPGSRFGRAAESPIFQDYLSETHGLPWPAALAKGTDWSDSGRLDEYLDELLRHHKLDRAALTKQNPQRPDILTTRGPTRLRGGVSVANRNEWYEIKPWSPTGIRKGQAKKEFLLPFMRTTLHGFYVAGSSYPRHPSGERRIGLIGSPLFDHGLRVLMIRLRIISMKIYLKVTRPEDGLLYYQVCLELELDPERRHRKTLEVLASGLAKHVFAFWLVCHAPLAAAWFEGAEPDHAFRDDPLPRIHCRFDVIDQIRDWQPRLEQDMFTRGIGYPGEQYLVACEEAFYRRLVPEVPLVSVADLWRQLLSKTQLMVTAIAGQSVWNTLQPIILQAKDMTVQRLTALFPGMEDFVNTLLSWVARNPFETVVIVLGAVVVTAAVAALWEVALLPVLEEGAAGAVSALAPRATSGLGRFAATETQATRLFAPTLRTVGTRGLLSASEVSAQLGGTGTAANDVAYTQHLLSAPFVRAAAKVAGVGVGSTMMLSTTEARAQTDPNAGPAAGKVIASHAARLFIAPCEPWPWPGRRPLQGQTADLEPHILKERLSVDRDPPMRARFLGHFTVT
jgi:hypothetical protein